MKTPDLTVTEHVLRRRVLGRRADMRLAQALRHQLSLREKLALLRGEDAQPRRQCIRHWQDGRFVEQVVTLPRAA